MQGRGPATQGERKALQLCPWNGLPLGGLKDEMQNLGKGGGTGKEKVGTTGTQGTVVRRLAPLAQEGGDGVPPALAGKRTMSVSRLCEREDEQQQDRREGCRPYPEGAFSLGMDLRCQAVPLSLAGRTDTVKGT